MRHRPGITFSAQRPPRGASGLVAGLARRSTQRRYSAPVLVLVHGDGSGLLQRVRFGRLVADLRRLGGVGIQDGSLLLVGVGLWNGVFSHSSSSPVGLHPAKPWGGTSFTGRQPTKGANPGAAGFAGWGSLGYPARARSHSAVPTMV